MELNNEIENAWKEGRAREKGLAPFTGKDLQAIISSRVRKELKTVSQFVWAAIAYQDYSSLVPYAHARPPLGRHSDHAPLSRPSSALYPADRHSATQG